MANKKELVASFDQALQASESPCLVCHMLRRGTDKLQVAKSAT
jgi:hypothetical protein